jgi:voltage-gated potassium channel
VSIETRSRWENRTTVPLFVLGAAFIVAYSFIVLVLDMPVWLTVVTRGLLVFAWVAFAVDYAVRLALTQAGERATFVRSNLFDLLSVFMPIFRAFSVVGRLRDVPFFRNRDARAVRVQIVTYMFLYAVIFIYFIAILTLQVERDAPGALIDSFGDAIWWALVTVATVGYGDTYPVTGLGRVYAVILMFGGIAIVGTASALVISFISERVSTATKRDGAGEEQS